MRERRARAASYPPIKEEAVLSAFTSKTNKTIKGQKYILPHTYDQGPSIGERLIVITGR